MTYVTVMVQNTVSQLTWMISTTEVHLSLSPPSLRVMGIVACIRYGKWKKCLGSTKPEWLGSRGPQGPGGVQGQCPAGGTRGAKPLIENKFGYFGDQFAASQCTEIVKTIFFFFALKLKIRSNISLLSVSRQFLKLPT